MNQHKECLLSAAAFSPYPFAKPSAWIGHLPFAAWLIKSLKPKTFVELGTHWGHSYFSFCQAVSEGSLPTKCYGVDIWEGDEHAGNYGNEVFNHVHAHNLSQYESFSHLLRMRFDDAVSNFDNASIDLLHIDGFHTYEAVKHDFEVWLPKLAPGAIVLLHDTNVHERGFGVWKFWSEIQQRYSQHLEFLHSYGLGVLQIDGAVGAKKFSWLNPDSGEQQTIKAYFNALGARQIERFESIDLLNRYQTQITELHQQIATLNEGISQRDSQIKMILSSTCWRLTMPCRWLVSFFNNIYKLTKH